MSKLREAMELIAPRGRWCKGALAKDKTGEQADPDEVRAHSYCAIGAIMKVTGKGDVIHQFEIYPRNTVIPEHKYLLEAAQELGYTSVPDLNDESSKKKVLEMFCRAICLEAKRKEEKV